MTENLPPNPPAGLASPTPPAAPPPPPPTGPPPHAPPAYYYPPPPRRSFARTLFMTLMGFIFISSIVLNLYLAAIVASQVEMPFVHSIVRDGNDKQVVAVYDIAGIIDGDAAADFGRFCKEVLHDGKVRAVVLRVNSPGGTVTASDQMHEMVRQLKQEGNKTVVVSMGDMAASGGYYVSAPADEIFAEPTTVTGSIGVIWGWVVLEGTLEKLGMETVVMKSSNARGWKDEMSSFQQPDERQRKHMQEILDAIQDRFETVVRSGRAGKLRENEVRYTLKVGKGEQARDIQHTETEPLNGKIYLPDDALKLGLIDHIDYLDRALDRAAGLAGLSSPKVVRYARRKGLMEQLLESRSSAGLTIDARLLEKLQTPRLMMMWRAD